MYLVIGTEDTAHIDSMWPTLSEAIKRIQELHTANVGPYSFSAVKWDQDRALQLYADDYLRRRMESSYTDYGNGTS